MARLLTYLVEVTERFGMETRTELILLQRTMVVVEGVARTLNPHINIWEVARPVVEDYIKESIGPKALLADLAKTARVLARFGPRLPQMAEAALIRQAGSPSPEMPKRNWSPVFWAMSGLLVGGVAVFAALSLSPPFRIAVTSSAASLAPPSKMRTVRPSSIRAS